MPMTCPTPCRPRLIPAMFRQPWGKLWRRTGEVCRARKLVRCTERRQGAMPLAARYTCSEEVRTCSKLDGTCSGKSPTCSKPCRTCGFARHTCCVPARTCSGSSCMCKFSCRSCCRPCRTCKVPDRMCDKPCRTCKSPRHMRGAGGRTRRMSSYRQREQFCTERSGARQPPPNARPACPPSMNRFTTTRQRKETNHG